MMEDDHKNNTDIDNSNNNSLVVTQCYSVKTGRVTEILHDEEDDDGDDEDDEDEEADISASSSSSAESADKFYQPKNAVCQYWLR